MKKIIIATSLIGLFSFSQVVVTAATVKCRNYHKATSPVQKVRSDKRPAHNSSGEVYAFPSVFFFQF